MSRPFLLDAERRSALAYLSTHPDGSQREWAEALGWTRGKLRRFLEALHRSGLADVTTSGWRSHFELRPTAPKPAHRKPESGPNRPTPEVTQEQSVTEFPTAIHTAYLGLDELQLPRCAQKRGKSLGNCGAEALISVLNEVMVYRFGDLYPPIQPDHRGSHRAAYHFAEAGIPLEDSIRLLREKARHFNPEKAGGKLPISVGYFRRWLMLAWTMERRQYPLPLMTVERKEPECAAVLMDRTEGPPLSSHPGSGAEVSVSSEPVSEETLAWFHAEKERLKAQCVS